MYIKKYIYKHVKNVAFQVRGTLMSIYPLLEPGVD